MKWRQAFFRNRSAALFHRWERRRDARARRVAKKRPANADVAAALAARVLLRTGSQRAFADLHRPSNVELRGRTVIVRTHKMWCEFDEPNASISAATRFAYGLRSPHVNLVKVEQADSVQVGLGAALLINAIAMDGHTGTTIRGRLPDDGRAFDIASASGLPRVLGLRGDRTSGTVFRFRCTRKTSQAGRTSLLAPGRESADPTELVEILDHHARDIGRKLSTRARKGAFKCFAEIVENAERHSGTTTWYLSAYLERQVGSTNVTAHVAVLSIGRTIAENMMKVPDDSVHSLEYARLERAHSKWIPSKKAKANDYRAMLWTALALQPGVSSKNTKPEADGSQGTGTFKFLQGLGDLSSPSGTCRAAVISGPCALYFDRKLGAFVSDAAEGVAGRIALNKSQNLAQRFPERRALLLQNTIPGTLVSLEFTIDPNYLEPLKTADAGGSQGI